MAKKYEISEEGLNELREARIRNRDKSVERRLYALILHAEGIQVRRYRNSQGTTRSISMNYIENTSLVGLKPSQAIIMAAIGEI